MATKTVTIVPDAYSTEVSPSSDQWHTYDGKSEISTSSSGSGVIWFRFPAAAISYISGTIYSSGAITSGYYDIAEDINYSYYYQPIYNSSHVVLNTLSVYPYSGSTPCNFSSGDRYIEGKYFYIQALSSQYMSVAVTSFRGTVVVQDIEIKSISPESIQTEFDKEQKITISTTGIGPVQDDYYANDVYADGTVSLVANNKTIASCKISSGIPHNEWILINDYIEGSVRFDRYTFNCSTDWFKTIESTDDTITVTVKIEDESTFNRKATGTFEITKPPLSIEVDESNVVMTGSSYENNRIDVTGEYSGKFTVTVKHGNTTESPYQIDATNRFDVSVQKSWFYNQSFTSTNITVTLQDEIYRVRQASFTASLPTLEISLDRNSYNTDNNNTIEVTLSNAVGMVSISYKIGSGSWEGAGSSILLSSSIFADTRSNQLSVTIKAEVPGYKQSAQTSTTVTAGANVYPQISYMAVSNVPNIHMPSEYARDYVQGYSKVAVTVQYTEGAASISDPPDLKLTGLGEAVTLTKNGDYYKATTTSVITRETTLTVTVTDTMGRKGQETYTIKEDDIVMLPNITITPQSTSVEAGEYVYFYIEGFVGTYDISFMALNQKLSGGGTGQSASLYGQEAYAGWFDSAGATGKSLSVTVVVTDVLGGNRSKSITFSVTLPTFKLELDPVRDVQIDTDLTITIKGAAGQTVSMVFTTPKDDETVELYSGTASATIKVVRCPKSWFTGFDTVASLPITISATAGTQSTTALFFLNYPALGLAITKTVDSQEVAVTSATVGENLNYDFSNLAGESVNIDYVYPAQNNRQLLQYGPYSTAQTIATPQLFDMANPPVTKSLSMQVNIVISDVRGRTATVSNFTINASASMGPGVYDSEFEPINPPTVDSAFATDFIGNVTRLSATVKASSGSMAKVTEAILSIDGANVTMTPNGVDSSGKYVFTYVGNSPLQVDAIYDPRQVNLTVGYGLNSGGKVVENPQRAATVYPISVRKNNTYKVYYSGQYTAQCALWSGDTFDRIVTNSQYSPYEVSFDTGNCDKVYVSLLRRNETSTTDPVDVEEANLMIRVSDSGMVANLTPISFNVTLKDERGLSVTEWVGTAFAYPYNAPNASIGYHRCNQDGTPNDSGGNCLLTCDFSFEGLWLNAFPPSPQNRGYVTVSTSNYDETKQFDFTKWRKAQFTLVAGYGLNSSGEVVSNPLRAATTTPYIVTEGGSPGGPATHAAYKVTFDGDYIVEYARWEENTLIRQGTINSSGQYITAEVGESLYISLKRSNETSESAPVDISEANVQLTLNLGDSEDGSFEFLIPNMSIEQTYQITITLTDLITSTVYTVTLSTGYAIMDFYRGGKGVAIGKVAEHSTMLEVNPTWELKASVKINGQLYDLATLLSQIKQQLGI